MNTTSNPTSIVGEDGELSFSNLLAAIWGQKYIFLAVSVVVSAIAIGIALFIPNKYTASVLIAPSDGEVHSVGSIASEYAGLARLAGFDPGTLSKTGTDTALEVLRSRKFLIDFIKRHDILVDLFAADGWDPASGEVTLDAEVFDAARGEWTRDYEPPQAPKPSDLEGYEAFLEIFSISDADTPGFYVLKVQHYSPTIAKQWVSNIVADINEVTMDKDVAEARRAIEFLEEQLATNTLSELRSVLFNLIGEQMKTLALARANPEYVFEVIDPALVPEVPSSPNRLLIVLLGGFFGAGLGIVAALVRHRRVARR